MSVSFTVDFSKLPSLHPSSFQFDSARKIGERLSEQNKAYLPVVENGIAEFHSKQLPHLNRLKLAQKVTSFVLGILPILLASTFIYAPLWVPFAVGIPSILIVALIRGKLASKIDPEEHYFKYLLLLQKMLKEHTFKALHPLGEWDLPEIDPRLKSDLMMKKELKKRHPEAPIELESVVQNYDLEVSRFALIQAAKKIAQISDHDSHWSEAQDKVFLAKAALKIKEGQKAPDFDKYRQLAEEARTFSMSKGKALDDFNFPLPSVKGEIRSVVEHYAYFFQLYKKNEALYKELTELYKDQPFADLSDLNCSWKEYDAMALAVKRKMDLIIEKAEKEKRGDFLSLAASLGDLPENLFFICHQSKSFSLALRSRIAQHPSKRIAAYKKKLEDLSSKTLKAETENLMRLRSSIKKLSNKVRPIIENWMKKKGSLSKESLQEFRKKNKKNQEILSWIVSAEKLLGQTTLNVAAADKELEAWMDLHPRLRAENLDSLIRRNAFMREKIHKANLVFNEIQQIPKDEEEYQKFVEKMDSFASTSLEEAKKALGFIGILSRWERFRKEVFRKLIPPAKPFEKSILGRSGEKTPLLYRIRKVEEVRINELLKKVDREMILTNRARQYGIQGTVAVFLIAESILAFFYVNPWLNWGFVVAIAAVRGTSFFIERRLRERDEEKQALKLHSLFRDRPLVKRIPGNCPQLERLGRFEQIYGLDGTSLTRSRISKKGIRALTDFKKETKARPYLERRYVMLEGRLQANPKEAAKLENEEKRLREEIQRVTNPPELAELQFRLDSLPTVRRDALYKTLYPSDRKSLSVKPSGPEECLNSDYKAIDTRRDVLYEKIKLKTTHYFLYQKLSFMMDLSKFSKSFSDEKVFYNSINHLIKSFETALKSKSLPIALLDPQKILYAQVEGLIKNCEQNGQVQGDDLYQALPKLAAGESASILENIPQPALENFLAFLRKMKGIYKIQDLMAPDERKKQHLKEEIRQIQGRLESSMLHNEKPRVFRRKIDDLYKQIENLIKDREKGQAQGGDLYQALARLEADKLDSIFKSFPEPALKSFLRSFEGKMNEIYKIEHSMAPYEMQKKRLIEQLSRDQKRFESLQQRHGTAEVLKKKMGDLLHDIKKLKEEDQKLKERISSLKEGDSKTELSKSGELNAPF